MWDTKSGLYQKSSRRNHHSLHPHQIKKRPTRMRGRKVEKRQMRIVTGSTKGNQTKLKLAKANLRKQYWKELHTQKPNSWNGGYRKGSGP
jgi:hypothetical protein